MDQDPQGLPWITAHGHSREARGADAAARHIPRQDSSCDRDNERQRIQVENGKVVAYRGTTIDALIKALRALGVEGCDVADVLGFVPDDEIASIGEGSTSACRRTSIT